MSKVSVLFVCMGNICRSPTAHGVFEKLVNMDEDNIYDLNRKCPEEYKDKIHLMLEIGGIAESRGFVGVPDPYYGGSKGFDFVFDLVEESSKNLLDLIKKERLS